MSVVADVSQFIFKLRSCAFKLLLGFTQFFQLDLCTQFLLDATDQALQLADQIARHPRGLRQTLGAEDNQGDNADQQQFAETEIKHGLGFVFVFFVVDDFVFFGWIVGAFVQALFEIMHGTAEVFADIAQFFGAEHQNHDDQNDNPVPNRKAAHFYSFMFSEV